MLHRVAVRLFRRVPSVILLVALLVLTPLLGACDISVGQKQVVVVTATTQPQGQVVVVTATSTQAQVQVQPSPAAQQPTADVQATVQAALAATLAAQPTDTPIPPTNTPVPPTPDLQATLQAMLQLTQAAMPTNTPIPPTNTPKPTTKPTAKPTSVPKTATPVSYPPTVLLTPNEDFSCYNAQGCFFSWSWGMPLAANQYFQVQLVGPGGEHRGIHPPTKEYSFQSNWSVYQIIRDWCDPNKMCHMQWTVAVVEWDGVDPSKIGRMLTESAWRWVWL